MSDSFRLVEDLIPTPMKTRARISRKQTGESIPSTDRVFTMLMGDEVEPRRDFIEANALRAGNIDV
jgi:DNA gyrase subunit B